MDLKTDLLRTDLEKKGFALIKDLFKPHELERLQKGMNLLSYGQGNLLHHYPQFIPVLLKSSIKALVQDLIGANPLLVKSIFFNKPPECNWFVPWHQDLSIQVKKRHETAGYRCWTQKRGVHGVIPPVSLLENMLTLRVQLDDADADTGTLRVLPGSHDRGIIRKEKEPLDLSEEHVCECPAGSVLLMKPLLMHASHRAKRFAQRRIIHLEFSTLDPEGSLEWMERIPL